VAPFVMGSIMYTVPSCVNKPLDYDPFKQVNFRSLNLHLSDLELNMTAFQAYRTQQLKVKKSIIQELENIVADQSHNVVSKCNSNSEFKSLSNVSDSKALTGLEEKRNLFDVLKDSCSNDNASNTNTESETSDVEVIDLEENCSAEYEDGRGGGGPPCKKQKTEIEEERPINDGKRLLDRFMECSSPEFLLVSFSVPVCGVF